jgi:hypothetical protein
VSYTNISKIASDPDLRTRIATCAAMEQIKHPWGWLDEHIWEFIGQPAWGSQYDYAVETNVPTPGLDQGVISDGMILSAVQAIKQSELPPG